MVPVSTHYCQQPLAPLVIDRDEDDTALDFTRMHIWINLQNIDAKLIGKQTMVKIEKTCILTIGMVTYTKEAA